MDSFYKQLWLEHALSPIPQKQSHWQQQQYKYSHKADTFHPQKPSLVLLPNFEYFYEYIRL